MLGSTIGITSFTIYVSLFVKGIIFRPNDEGNTVFTPGNLFDLAIYPLESTDFWMPKMWTINFVIHLFSSIFLVYLVQHMQLWRIE